MTYNTKLLQACFDVWKAGYKRDKGLQYCGEVLGTPPSEEEYIKHFRKMFDDMLGVYKKRGRIT